MSYSAELDKEYLTMQVTEFQKGSVSAFERIYPMISGKLLRYATVVTGDLAEAEDLLQDTMMEVCKSIGTLRDPSLFMTWSTRIMRNVYSHKIRKLHDMVARNEEDLSVFEDLEDEDLSYRPDAVIEDASIGAIVRDEIDRLPASQRLTMVAYYIDGLSVREISEMMGTTENTTKSRLFAGRKR